ncbi:POC1 centriolar protein homolog [Contarinia nasturtii]|uniref:POC1 centriolar protein homolog n=1 Tax=Contarinia nasturtii TaxID=265458 RepID=UPI0012D4AE03|nr:POC1 centriolar protein homolog [Contarinia nasturtii]
MESFEDPAPILLRHFRGHHGPITCLAYNSNQHSNKLASSSTDKSVNLWNTEDRIRCFKFSGHSDIVNGVAWSHNGQLMATASKDRTIKVWVPTVRGSSCTFPALSAVRSVEFHPKDRKLVTATDDKAVKLWSIDTKRFAQSFLGHTNRVNCARYSPSGKTVASCSDDRTLKLFDVNSGECVQTFTERGNVHGNDVAWHPNGGLIAIALSNSQIKIFDIKARKLIQLYSVHLDGVNSIAFHPSGNLMITASEDGSTKVLDLLEGRPIYTLVGHDDAVTAVTFSGDGSNFATASKDKQIMLWSLNMDIINDNDISSAQRSIENDRNMGNILDTSVMIDPRKTTHYKFCPDDYDIME